MTMRGMVPYYTKQASGRLRRIAGKLSLAELVHGLGQLGMTVTVGFNKPRKEAKG